MNRKPSHIRFKHQAQTYLNDNQHKWFKEEMAKTGWSGADLIRALIDRKMKEFKL